MLKPQCNSHRFVISLNGVWEYAKSCPLPGKEFVPEGRLAVPASWNEQHNSLYHHKGRVW